MLKFPGNMFDLVYLISIFTHLEIETQKFWINELSRVLKPGGFLLFTYHGSNYHHLLPPEAHARASDGEIVVMQAEMEGSNACATFHSERSIRRALADRLEVVDFVPEGMVGAHQDIALLRKPPVM
jgi:ubiquinone/menaquinone biosynthesis C-methylase UbiE